MASKVISEFQQVIRDEKKLRDSVLGMLWEEWFAEYIPKKQFESIKASLSDAEDLTVIVDSLLKCVDKAEAKCQEALDEKKEEMKTILSTLREDVKTLQELDPERYGGLSDAIREAKAACFD